MILLVTPTVMEMQSLLSVAEHTFLYDELTQASAGYIQTGYYNGIPISIGICGVGPILSAITTTTWLNTYAIDAILVCGIAGAYSIHTLPITSVVFITQDIYAEYGIRTGEYVCARDFPFFHDETHAIREKLVLPKPQQCFASLGLTYNVCAEVTGITIAGVSSNRETAQAIHHNYPEAEVETMEGFSLGLVCTCYNIPLIHLRAISNEVGIRVNWEIEASLHNLAITLASFWS